MGDVVAALDNDDSKLDTMMMDGWMGIMMITMMMLMMLMMMMILKRRFRCEVVEVGLLRVFGSQA